MYGYDYVMSSVPLVLDLYSKDVDCRKDLYSCRRISLEVMYRLHRMVSQVAFAYITLF